MSGDAVGRVPLFVKWIDGDGTTWEAPAGTSYPWPGGLELPQVGDSLSWPGVDPVPGGAEVIGRRWVIPAAGSASGQRSPRLVLTCDLGPYSHLPAAARQDGQASSPRSGEGTSPAG